MVAGRSALQERDIFTVTRHGDGWAVEHNGLIAEAVSSKDEAHASAHKLARAAHDAGRPAQVTVAGEIGFFQPGVTGRR
ncbi:MAG TPA: hypothetical protein VJP88_09255 [Caulobacteraceae bacterium]|nr:hypothetical protein [Caulobacteraceae bacterium]